MRRCIGFARRFYGFSIVEGPGRDIPRHWHAAAATEDSAEALAASLPHRTPAEREQIAAAVLGVTTWQRACDPLGVPTSVLIDSL